MKTLNIFNATGNPSSGWSTTNQLNEDSISLLMDQAAKSGSALNAIPSPFSRLHIFETAFKLVTKDLRDQQERASMVYRELVSDCLDALELVFNARFHQSQQDQLVFKQWRTADLTTYAEQGGGPEVFAKTVQLFVDKDFKGTDHAICLVEYNGAVIAGTSPYTLLFTAPNFDKEDGKFKNDLIEQTFGLINPSTGSHYFKKYRPFSKRSDQFKAYLADLFEGNSQLKRNAAPLWAYLVEEGIQRVKMDVLPVLTNIPCQNGSTFGLSRIPLKANADEGAGDIFNDHIIKVDYRIDRRHFYTATFKEEDQQRRFDYLLPVRIDFLKNVPLDAIPKHFIYEMQGSDTVKVTYTGDLNTSVKSKTFTLSGRNRQDGKVIDIDELIKVNFTVGIFPFLKVTDRESRPIDRYNNYYKVVFAVDAIGHPDQALRTDDFNLTFFKMTSAGIEQISADGGAYRATRYARRTFESPDQMASIYYQLDHTCFDLIQLSLPAIGGRTNVKGMIVPKWQQKRLGSKEFTYSVDFGTTNTFIAYSNDPEKTSTPLPLSITADDLQMVMLQQPATVQGGQSVTASYSSGTPTGTMVTNIITHEFVPPVLLGTENDSPFKMPFRTAVFEPKNVEDFVLFNDINIHFAYQKAALDAATTMHQDVKSNIKWEVANKHDPAAKKRVENYIRELCYIMRFKTLMNDGDPEKVRVNWFIPQSFSIAAKDAYKAFWNKEVASTLGSRVNTKTIMESEAPYYYLRKQARIDDTTAVLSLDIGGGSTDAMLFIKNIATAGTSFNFAGNVLWSNGYNQLVNDARDNGFYDKLQVPMEEKIKKHFSLQQNYIYFQKRSTDEIINFWLANNDKLDVVSELQNKEFQIIYLVHYSAIIYHVAQFLKAGNNPAPTCIIFSGNGSKYIDLLGSPAILSRVAGFIIDKVYDRETKAPQVILPAENRKEATCFGGVFKEDDIAFPPLAYLGTELNFPRLNMIKKYRDIEGDLDQVKESVTLNILQLFRILQELNQIYSFKHHLNIDDNIDAIYNMMADKLGNYFDNGYGNRMAKVEGTEEISDSLFFYPLVGVIFELGRKTDGTLEPYIPTTLRFTNRPSGYNTFDSKSFDERAKSQSIYQIAISSVHPNEATYEIIDSDNTRQRIFADFDQIVKPVCWFEDVNTAAGMVKFSQLNKGRLRKDGESWVVTEQLKLKFHTN